MVFKKQNSVALSSTEAECIAGASAAQELVFVKGVATDMYSEDVESVLLLIDNQGTIELTKGFENSKRSKHIDIKYHCIK